MSWFNDFMWILNSFKMVHPFTNFRNELQESPVIREDFKIATTNRDFTVKMAIFCKHGQIR